MTIQEIEGLVLSLKERIEFLEEIVYKIEIALTSNVATREQVMQLSLLKQKDIDAIKNELIAINNKVNIIEKELFG